MKIDRLIGILSILLQQEKVTAPYLADKFEVSRRTINRDIEDICKAGIPVVTSQGQNGGISIMDGYRMDKTLLTSSDMQAILAGLKSLDSVSGTKRYQQLMEKLASGNNSVLASNPDLAVPQSGSYTIGESTDYPAFSINSDSYDTYLNRYDANGNVTETSFTAGTMDIAYENGIYTIECKMTTVD